MFKAIKNFLNSFIFKKPTFTNEYIFTIVGEVLIVQIPTGRLPPLKAEDYIKKQIELLGALKKELGVSHIIGFARPE
jgi:hypothetical protein